MRQLRSNSCRWYYFYRGHRGDLSTSPSSSSSISSSSPKHSTIRSRTRLSDATASSSVNHRHGKPSQQLRLNPSWNQFPFSLCILSIALSLSLI
ncbi:hypothetical protein Hanom_Chr09g00868921 [Helianthus anomalus]